MKSRSGALAAYTAMMLAEVCVLAVAQALIGRTLGADFTSQVLVLLAYPLTFLAGRLAMRFSPRSVLPVKAAGWIVVVLGVSVAAFGELIGSDLAQARPEMVIGAALEVALAGLGGWLGASLSQTKFSYRRAVTRFQAGILALLALAPFAGGVAIPVVLFVLFWALALVLARWEDARGKAAGVLRPLPAGGLPASVAAVAVLGGLVAVFFTPGVAQTVVNGLGDFAGLIGSRGMPQTAGEPIDIRFSCDFKPEDEGFTLPGEPPSGEPRPIDPVFYWVAGGLIVAAVGVALVFAIRRLRRPTAPADEDDALVEAAGERLFWREGLKRLLNRLKDAWQRLRQWISQPARTAVDADAVSVRAVYRRVLAWAASRGQPRLPSQTPLEFARLLTAAFPEKVEEVAVITGAYLEARYRRGFADPASPARARAAWESLRGGAPPVEHR